MSLCPASRQNAKACVATSITLSLSLHGASSATLQCQRIKPVDPCTTYVTTVEVLEVRRRWNSSSFPPSFPVLFLLDDGPRFCRERR
jgi:hypothetical protein